MKFFLVALFAVVCALQFIGAQGNFEICLNRIFVLTCFLIFTVDCPKGIKEFRNHESDNTKFYECWDGTSHLRDCGAGTKFVRDKNSTACIHIDA